MKGLKFYRCCPQSADTRVSSAGNALGMLCKSCMLCILSPGGEKLSKFTLGLFLYWPREVCDVNISGLTVTV